jgi:hypothetical protein
MDIDRTILRLIRADIEAALAPIAKQYGIEIKAGGGTFEPKRFTLKIEGAVPGDNGQIVHREAEDFTRYATHVGLKPEHLGQTVVLMGTSYKIAGLRLKASKNNILLEPTRGGKRCVAAPAHTVQWALSHAAHAAQPIKGV